MPNLDLVCKECGKNYYIKDKDREFFERTGLDIPKRCWDCRQKRKKDRETKVKAAVYKK